MSFILRSVDSHRLATQVFRGFSYFSIGLAFLAVFAAIQSLTLALMAVTFNLLSACLNRLPQYRRLPGAVLISFTIVVFFSLPIVYIAHTCSAYDFTAAYVAPEENSLYISSLPGAIGLLIILFSALVVGMVIGDRWQHRAEVVHTPIRVKRGISKLMLLAIFVAAVHYFDTVEYFYAISESATKSESILSFLFLDKAYLLLFPFMFYGLAHTNMKVESLRWKAIFLSVVCLFTLLSILDTSKGAILTIFVMFFLYPLDFYSRTSRAIYWPSSPALLALVFLVGPLFVLTLVKRQAAFAGLDLTFQDYASAITQMNLGSWDSFAALVIDPVLNRLASNFQNFVNIYTNYFSAYDFAYAQHYGNYVLKSFLNLVLPGTPFPESYIPSSNLLPQVLSKSVLVGEGDRSSFWASANTQPYSIFGVLLVLVGPVLAIPVMALLGFVYVFLYRHSLNLLVRISLLFGFQILLASYGLETALQLALHVAVAVCFMYCILQMSKRWLFLNLRQNVLPIRT